MQTDHVKVLCLSIVKSHGGSHMRERHHRNRRSWPENIYLVQQGLFRLDIMDQAGKYNDTAAR